MTDLSHLGVNGAHTLRITSWAPADVDDLLDTSHLREGAGGPQLHPRQPRRTPVPSPMPGLNRAVGRLTVTCRTRTHS